MTMDSLDYWRLCDSVSVVQAALLIVGEDPTGEHYRIERRISEDQPIGYEAVRIALQNAIERKKLPALIGSVQDDEGNSCVEWNHTTIDVEDLRQWLRSRGVKTGFFFPDEADQPDFLSPHHENYSAKLAAAVEAWKAVSGSPELRRNKSVKQALDKWLRQNANRFGLTKDDGNPNESGIEQIATVANWETKGGAPRTPGSDESGDPF